MRILIQAGHKGRTSGATGAPGEQKWTSEIVPKIASKLREHGIEVGECNADPTAQDIAGDWDLFLSVHYDADIYNDRGAFIDTPDPSTDFATKESNRIADEMRKTYFSITGIPEKMNRSNKNTKFYYMWSKMSANTPCVIIEAGVGWRVEEDWRTLWHSQDKVVEGITSGILKALMPEIEDPCELYKQQLIIVQKQLDSTLIVNGRLSEENQNLRTELENQECPECPEIEPIIEVDCCTFKKMVECIKKLFEK